VRCTFATLSGLTFGVRLSESPTSARLRATVQSTARSMRSRSAYMALSGTTRARLGGRARLVGRPRLAARSEAASALRPSAAARLRLAASAAAAAALDGPEAAAADGRAAAEGMGAYGRDEGVPLPGGGAWRVPGCGAYDMGEVESVERRAASEVKARRGATFERVAVWLRLVGARPAAPTPHVTGSGARRCRIFAQAPLAAASPLASSSPPRPYLSTLALLVAPRFASCPAAARRDGLVGPLQRRLPLTGRGQPTRLLLARRRPFSRPRLWARRRRQRQRTRRCSRRAWRASWCSAATRRRR
jgi:hypothetical protein